MLGSNPSAESGTKTENRGGFITRLCAAFLNFRIGTNALNPRGSGTESPSRSLLKPKQTTLAKVS